MNELEEKAGALVEAWARKPLTDEQLEQLRAYTSDPKVQEEIALKEGAVTDAWLQAVWHRNLRLTVELADAEARCTKLERERDEWIGQVEAENEAQEHTEVATREEIAQLVTERDVLTAEREHVIQMEDIADDLLKRAEAAERRVERLVEALQSVQHNRVCSCYRVLHAPCPRCVVGYDDVDIALHEAGEEKK